MQVLFLAFQSSEGPIDFRAECEQNQRKVLRPGNFPPQPGETSRQPEMETLAPLFRVQYGRSSIARARAFLFFSLHFLLFLFFCSSAFLSFLDLLQCFIFDVK